jgi:hypothetical protein
MTRENCWCHLEPCQADERKFAYEFGIGTEHEVNQQAVHASSEKEQFLGWSGTAEFFKGYRSADFQPRP